VDDRGVAHLKVLTNLGRLELQGTAVTSAGLRELRAAVPGIILEQ
jgi:hypothetical protein